MRALFSQPVMSEKRQHDRASGEVELLIIGGLFVLGFVTYAVIQSFIEALWNNPAEGIETIHHITHGLGEFVGSLSGGALFVLILVIGGLGRLLE